MPSAFAILAPAPGPAMRMSMLPETALKTVAPAAEAAAVAAARGVDKVPVKTIFLPARLAPAAFAFAFALPLALAFGSGSPSAGPSAFLLAPAFAFGWAARKTDLTLASFATSDGVWPSLFLASTGAPLSSKKR